MLLAPPSTLYKDNESSDTLGETVEVRQEQAVVVTYRGVAKHEGGHACDDGRMQHCWVHRFFLADGGSLRTPRN